MARDEERLESEQDADTGAEPGLLGGGGPARTIEPADPADEDAHLADTDHDER